MKEITLKEWSAYLPYGLKLWYEDNKDIYPLVVSNNTVSIRGGFNINDVKSYNLKPILYDLSWLTREITHEGETFVPIEKFEIGDDDSGIEYDHGNIRLIKDLESISKYNSYHDIQFLPFEVVQRLIEWKFNIFFLPDELIVRVSEDFNPYK